MLDNENTESNKQESTNNEQKSSGEVENSESKDSGSSATTGGNRRRRAASRPAGAPDGLNALFQAPPEVKDQPKAKKSAKSSDGASNADSDRSESGNSNASRNKSGSKSSSESSAQDGGEPTGGNDETDESDRPKRRRRGGRKRGAKKTTDNDSNQDSSSSNESQDGNDKSTDDSSNDSGGQGVDSDDGNGGTTRRRRRRQREGNGQGGAQSSNQQNKKRGQSDRVTGVKGSTRIEAKKQRRREGREAGRRRAPVLTEAEFLARRESVKRSMIVREQGDRVQIAVLEDGVLAEHYVNRTTNTSMVGNIYLGRVQNVLPSMEAAFVDIGRGRNAVLYAGEVDWAAAGLEGKPKKIENALKSGDAVMVQVTKDPVGHKGARLTSQVSLPGRFLVYVPDGSMTGISRRLPDRERARLKKVLRASLPENSGVIVRTAAEGASEEQIVADIKRLTDLWTKVNEKAATAKAPSILSAEPDLATRVVRDIFNEDFEDLVVSGDQTGKTIKEYLEVVSPDLANKVELWTKNENVFTASRIDEQLAKALDRKVWLPSGGSLVIDNTEAMTVVDVNTGRFTGQGGNLEETVTENNLEAAEEIARQLRLRDVGGIIVIDFIDMVLESNRDLVLRRLIECLGRDRTKHQVAEVTSLGLVQMTRKRIGQGLLDTFSDECDACNGRGVKVHLHPVEKGDSESSTPPRRQRPTGPIPGAPTNKGASKSEDDDSVDGDDNSDESSEVAHVVDESEVEEAARIAAGSELVGVVVGEVVDEVDLDDDDDDGHGEDDGDDDSHDDHSDSDNSSHELTSGESPAW